MCDKTENMQADDVQSRQALVVRCCHKECCFCHAPLKLEIAETAIHTFQGHRNEYTINHEPSLSCTKCNNSFQSEPYQYEKTNVFLQFLMSIKLKSAEIEYKDIIRYVDKVLKFKGDED